MRGTRGLSTISEGRATRISQSEEEDREWPECLAPSDARAKLRTNHRSAPRAIQKLVRQLQHWFGDRAREPQPAMGFAPLMPNQAEIEWHSDEYGYRTLFDVQWLEP